MIEKPEIGAPCNGCGQCCTAQVCSVGAFVLGMVKTFGERTSGPCPALVWHGEESSCGLIERPGDYLSFGNETAFREAVKLSIFAGAGCDGAGDEPLETAGPKVKALVDGFFARHGREDYDRAIESIKSGRK